MSRKERKAAAKGRRNRAAPAAAAANGSAGGSGNGADRSGSLSLDEAFAIAVGHHQAGRLAEAEHLYRQILQLLPKEAAVLHNLGIVARQTGNPGLALDLVGQALAVRPDDADAHNTLGNVLRDMGRLDEAATSYARAVAHRPDFAEAHTNLADVLHELGRPDEAAAAYGRAIALKPGHAEAHYGLGIVLQAQNRLDEAVASYSRAAALRPDYAEAHNNLGNALQEQGWFDQAVASYERATELKPDFVQAHSNLGVALQQLGRIDEAMASYGRAVALDPDDPESHINYGNALKDSGRAGEALGCYDRALALKADLAAAQWNRALALLALGDYRNGWQAYEWRRRIEEWTPPAFPQPLWRGEPLDGRTILLHAEQGNGDTLQFVRYAPLVAAAGGRVVLEVQPGLARLFGTLPGIAELRRRGEALPPFDLHCPLMSLPLAFGTTLETIPAAVPYLTVPEDLRAEWRERFRAAWPERARLEVGLVWAGDPRKFLPGANAVDRRRSIALALLAPLAGTPGVRFHSLQKGEAAAQAHTPPAGMALCDRTEELADFADTAALIEQLDLVITVDTAVAHLAGALGKPVWVLSRFDGCWRWLLEREDSPWYPTLRLFRQPEPGNWAPAIARIAEELAAAAAGDTARLLPGARPPAGPPP